MNRHDVYAAIDAERLDQDIRWRNGRKNEKQYAFAAPHILILEECVAKLRPIWYGANSQDGVRDRLIKIAAVAVRALEEIQHQDGE